MLLLLLRLRYSIERWSGILSIYMKNQGPDFKIFPRLIDSTNIYEHPCISILAWVVINSSKQKTGSVCANRVYSQLEATDIEWRITNMTNAMKKTGRVLWEYVVGVANLAWWGVGQRRLFQRCSSLGLKLKKGEKLHK